MSCLIYKYDRCDMITKYLEDQICCKLATIGHLAAHSIIERYKSINNQGNSVHRV